MPPPYPLPLLAQIDMLVAKPLVQRATLVSPLIPTPHL